MRTGHIIAPQHAVNLRARFPEGRSLSLSAITQRRINWRHALIVSRGPAGSPPKAEPLAAADMKRKEKRSTVQMPHGKGSASSRPSLLDRRLQEQGISARNGSSSIVSSNVSSFKRSGANVGRKPVSERQLDALVKAAGGKAADAGAAAGRQVNFIPNKALPFIKQAADSTVDGLHKPIGLVIASAYILGTACHLSGVEMGGAWGPTATGAVVGGLYVMLNRFGMKRFWRAPRAPLNVVVTGGTKGIGKAMAREFLRCGDRVMVSSRSMQSVRRAMSELRDEVGPEVWVGGVDCEVSSPANVQRLADAAVSQMGSIDVWINNAGFSGTYQSFLDARPEQIQEVVQTNMVGCLLCTRAALRIMAAQPRGGHIFNMDGAGADGLPSPQYAAYGATKAGIAHLRRSLSAEVAQQGVAVGVHCLSPGMVLTNLLLAGASDTNKQIFNILCEQPETVAAYLVPRARTIAARGESSRYIRFLTLPRAFMRFVTAPLHANRFFGPDGERLYLPERERILGDRAKQTERLAARAARRSRSLALAYSMSLAGAYLIMAADTMGRLNS